jgi:hypothetical protein
MTRELLAHFELRQNMLAVSGAICAVGVAPSPFHVSAISVLATCVAEASQATEAPEAAARPLVECRYWVKEWPRRGQIRLYDAPRLGGARNAVRMRRAILQTADPRRMKIAEQDRELLAAAELPLLLSDAWWSDSASANEKSDRRLPNINPATTSG